MQIVTTRSRQVLQLVQRREHDISSEFSQILLVYMTLSLAVRILGDVAEVHQVDTNFAENFISALNEICFVGPIVQENVVKFQVVMNKASCMDLLECSDQLHAQRQYLLLREAAIPFFK